MSDTPAELNPLPEGEYAIAECFGHSTIIGRCTEVERFGTKMLAIESVWQQAPDGLLPPMYVGGAALYRFTPCSRDIAWARRAKAAYSLPDALRATLTPALLPPPVDERDHTFDDGQQEED